ncbi:MAG: L-threonine 3-dehydrogenase [Thermodesulfobacteriota bacterium]
MNRKMKAIVKVKPGKGAEMRSIPIPKIGPKDVLVQVKMVSICGTDLHIYAWDQWASSRIKLPRVFGHELSGEVIAVGDDVASVQVGAFVSAETHIPCGHCIQCRTGNAHVCKNVKILGVDVDGCFAEYVAIPEGNVWKNDKSLPLELTSLQEPLGNATYTVLTDEIVGKTVLASGCGPIGVMAIGVARACGASTIIGVDIIDYRLNLAKKMGADFVLNDKKEDIVEKTMSITDGEGVDVLLEMSGVPSTIRKGFKVLRNAGRASLLGIPVLPMEIDLSSDIIFKGVKVYGITGRRIFDTWYQLSRLLKSHRLDISPVITHRLRFEEFEKGFDLMMSGNCGKIILLL